MRKLQKFKVTINKGKETDRTPVGDERKVVDSAAEYHEIESENILANAKDKGNLQIVTIWEDKGEVKAPVKKVVKPKAVVKK